MSFEGYLAPLEEELIKKHEGKPTLGASISAHTEIVPYWEAADVALIGVQDYRGNDQEVIETEEDLHQIREVLYSYKRPLNTSHIVDLGNLISGETYEETLERIKLITVKMLCSGTLPVFFGGVQSNDVGIYKAFQELEEQVSFLYIDNRFDLSYLKDKAYNERHLNDLLLSTPNSLNSFYQLGHQTYLVDEDELKAFDKLNFEVMRLGDVRANIQHSEPLFRSAEVCSFDAGALKRAELPAGINTHSFGFTGEEACQLTWYAGISETTRVFNLSDFQGVGDIQNAEKLATMLWYFIEGFYNRKESLDFDSDKYVSFTVAINDTEEMVDFYKSTMTNRWWFKSADKYIPCNYSDYLETAQGDIPNRVFKKVMQ